MTSFLPSFKPSGAFHQPSSQQFSSSGFKPATTFIVPPLSPNQCPPKELLVKRNNNKDLGDLLAKKVKTTNCSENGSIQGSPASKGKTDDGGSYEHTSPMTEGSPVNMKEILRRINPIPSFDSNHAQFNGLPGASTLFDDETSLHVNTSYGQIQSALKTLEKKMLIHQEIEAQEAKLRALKLHFKLPIPSFPTVLPSNLPKGMSEDPNFIYGDIEFPFLSISTPFSEVHQLNEKLEKIEKFEKLPDQLPQAKIEIEDDLELDKSSTSEDILSSLLPTREETLRSEAEENDAPKKRASRKKNQNKMIIEEPTTKVKKIQEKVPKKIVIEREKEKPQSKVITEEIQEKEKPKLRKDDEASLYRKPVYYSSKRSERQQHRWEAAQEEEKLANSSDDEIESIEVMFGGSKDNETSIGPESQVDISTAMMRNKINNRGKPKMTWNPSSLNEVELSRFFKDVKTALKYNPTEQQMINMLNINNNDPQRALKYVKTNKAKCLESFKAIAN